MVQTPPRLQAGPNYALQAGELSAAFDANAAARSGSILDARTAALDSILSNAKGSAPVFGGMGLADLFNRTTGVAGNPLGSPYTLGADNRRAAQETADIGETNASASSKAAYVGALAKDASKLGDVNFEGAWILQTKPDGTQVQSRKTIEAANNLKRLGKIDDWSATRYDGVPESSTGKRVTVAGGEGATINAPEVYSIPQGEGAVEQPTVKQSIDPVQSAADEAVIAHAKEMGLTVSKQNGKWAALEDNGEWVTFED